MSTFSVVRAFLAVAGWSMLSSTSAVWGCPNCKEGLLDNGQAGINLARGFELSIYLMLGAPLLILATLAFVFYLQIRTAKGVLSFISTVTVFGTPVDVTLQELALETFFPADEGTREALRSLA